MKGIIMISDLFRHLEKKNQENIEDVNISNAKGVAKSIGYGALIGVLEAATILGGTILLLGAAGMITDAVTKKSE